MILGVGTDLADVERMQKSCAKERFLTRVFTEAEREYAKTKGERSEVYAGMFAAKEAVSKALGTGFSGFGPTEIEVLHNSAGQPEIRLSGGAGERFRHIGGKKLHLSISHDGGFAVAFAIAEG